MKQGAAGEHRPSSSPSVGLGPHRDTPAQVEEKGRG
jgi:hypothetical protein